LIIKSLIILTIPFIFRILREDKLPYKKGRIICLLNSIIVLILSALFYSYTDILVFGLWDTIFFYFINRWLFIHDKDSAGDIIATNAWKEQVQARRIKNNNAETIANNVLQANYLDIRNKALGFINNAMQQLPSKRNFDYVNGILEFAGYMGIITFEEHKAYFERWRSIYHNYNNQIK
jgi:hypothetical protein